MRKESVAKMASINVSERTHSDVLKHTGLNALERKYDELRNSTTLSPRQLPSALPTKGGIYLFLYKDTPLYVGRTKSLKQRYPNHISGDTKKASLAVKMARRAANTPAKYTLETKASYLYENNIKDFRVYFDEAQKIIKECSVQYIEEPNATMQALLEIYVIARLGLDNKDAYNELKTS